jgi:heme exporter protein A
MTPVKVMASRPAIICLFIETNPMLEAQDLGARRGDRALFSGLDFTVPAAQALLVTGANGSGKTTLLRIVAGLAQPASGTLSWRGHGIAAHAVAMRAEALYIGHAPALKDEMTAEENLASLASLHGAAADHDAVRAALAAWALDPQRSLPARALSQGQRRRVGLARLRLSRRPLWILDEPTAALDGAGVAMFEGVLEAHLAEGGSAVIATHHELVLAGRSPPTLRLQ